MTKDRFGSGVASGADVAQAEAQLKTTPDGQPFLETFTTNVAGLESLSAADREQVLEQLKSGKTRAARPRTLAIIIVVLAILALAFWWGLKH